MTLPAVHAQGGTPPRRPAPRSVLSWRVAALAGLASGLLALGAAELVAVLTGPSSEPLVAVSDAFVDRTPPWLKNSAISTFGTARQAVLLTGAAVVLAALSALAGVLASRGRFRGPWVGARAGALAGARRRHPAGRDGPVGAAERRRRASSARSC